MAQPIGEIIEVSTSGFVAQCFEHAAGAERSLCTPPAFGSYVKIGEDRRIQPVDEPAAGTVDAEEEDPFVFSAHRAAALAATSLSPNLIFALVSNARTAPLSSGRRPTALGMESEDEIRAHYPQIFELLTTEFSGMLVAYTGDDGRVRRHLPPHPPKIHAPVRACEPGEVMAITNNLSFLRFVLSMGQGMRDAAPADSLVAACLRNAFDARGRDVDFIENAGRYLLPLLADDYERLRGIVESALDGAW